jgi:hypothetical protein
MDSESFNTLYHYLRRTFQCLEIKAKQMGIDTEETSLIPDFDDREATVLKMAEELNSLAAKL